MASRSSLSVATCYRRFARTFATRIAIEAGFSLKTCADMGGEYAHLFGLGWPFKQSDRKPCPLRCYDESPEGIPVGLGRDDNAPSRPLIDRRAGRACVMDLDTLTVTIDRAAIPKGRVSVVVSPSRQGLRLGQAGVGPLVLAENKIMLAWAQDRRALDPPRVLEPVQTRVSGRSPGSDLPMGAILPQDAHPVVKNIDAPWHCTEHDDGEAGVEFEVGREGQR